MSFRRALVAVAFALSMIQVSAAWGKVGGPVEPTGERCETRSTCPVLTPAQRATLATGMQAWLKTQADKNALSGGITVGLLGQELASFATGDAEVNGSKVLKIDTKTRFPYASISKTFTAALIWKRIEAAALTPNPVITLDTHVSTFVPWQDAPGLKPDFWNSITVGGLLSHTSHQQDIDDSSLWTAATNENWSADRMISEAQTLSPVSGPQYCNVCYSILGKVLEDARLNGGQPVPLSTILEKEVFTNPAIGLPQAGVLLSTRLDDTFAFPQQGRYLTTEKTLRAPSLFFASGDVYGSLQDLGEWAAALFSRPETWVPPTFWSQVSPTGEANQYYTYGAQREAFNGATLVYKPAGFPFLPNEKAPYAYAHLLAYIPEYSLTFGYLQNGSDYFSMTAASDVLKEAMRQIDALRAAR